MLVIRVMQALLEPCMIKIASLQQSTRSIQYSVQQRGRKVDDTTVGRRYGYHTDRLTQTWGTCGKGIEVGSRLRADVGDTIWCGAPAK